MKFLIHYSEIGLKGKNRPFFENKLRDNIKTALSEFLKEGGSERARRRFTRSGNRLSERRKGENFFKKLSPSELEPRIRKLPGRFLLEAKSENEGYVASRLKKIFGIANFSQIEETVLEKKDDLGKLGEKIVESLKKRKFKTFKVEASRSDKSFLLNSQELNEKLGEMILSKMNKKVNLHNPDVRVFIEVVSGKAFYYFEKIAGSGGLPTGTSGKLVSLISGGIDSPVASWFMQKRGAKIVFVHFHSYPFTSEISQEVVRDLVKVLSEWQLGAKLYFVPLGEIQKEIVKEVPGKLRLIFYRRWMAKISELIAEKENARGVVSGESLGQVASQTMENLEVIGEAVSLPWYRPLIGFDKEEIIRKAREIGTYEISIQPFEDCCSFLVGSNPETRARLGEVKKFEKKIEKKLIKLSEKSVVEAGVEII